MSKNYTLHIYAQPVNHDRAYIVGTKESLVKLIGVISAAIENGSRIKTFSVSDGEEFELEVVITSPEEMEKLDLPYTNRSSMGLDQCPRGKSPASARAEAL